jgi:hypothetical protein
LVLTGDLLAQNPIRSTDPQRDGDFRGPEAIGL